MSQFIDHHAATPAAKLFWAVVGALALAMLAAMYMVCAQQVRKAEARHTEIAMQRMAMNDCLQYRSDTTIGSCARQMAAASRERPLYRADDIETATREAGAIVAVRSQMTTAMPVSFTYR